MRDGGIVDEMVVHKKLGLRLLLVASLLSFFALVSLPRSAAAQTCYNATGEEKLPCAHGDYGLDPGHCYREHISRSGDLLGYDAVDCGDPTGRQGNPDCPDLNNCRIIQNYLVPFIQVLSAVVGIVVVIMIVVGGIQYSISRDNPQAVAAARQRIFNALLALVVYLLMVVFLQWLVPGGVFSG